METKKRMIFVLAAAAFLLTTIQNTAAAQTKEDKEKAKEHFFKAKELVEQGAWKKAIVEFEASYNLNPVPMVLFNIAVCHDKLTEYARASDYYRRFILKGKNAPQEMKEEAMARIKELDKLIGLVELSIGGLAEGDEAGAEVVVDGNLIGKTPMGVFFLETGEHEITVRKEGYFESKKKFKVVSGQTTSLEVNLTKQAAKTVEEKQPPSGEKNPPAPPVEAGKERKKLGPAPFGAILGLTLAFGATAVITGALALHKDNEVASMKENENWQGLREESDNLALATDVLIGLGAAAAVTTVVLVFFTDFKKEKIDAGRLSFGLWPASPCGPMIGLGGMF